MSDSLGMRAVNRVPTPDRLPFIKALAYIALADDSVTIDEKRMVTQYAEAWGLSEGVTADLEDTLRSGTRQSLDALVASFSESGTRFLLVQELMRLSHADGTYGDAERREIAVIAQRLGMSEEQFREVEKWVGRGRAWEMPSENGEVPGQKDLEDVLEGPVDTEYDLSDIETGDSDLDDIDPGGYDIEADAPDPPDETV
jgi:uncharacterized tellurite resistance protein B-like protein